MEETFEEYLKQARKDFARVAVKYSIEEHLELRTAIDSLLVAYDQAAEQALSIANVRQQRELLLAWEKWKVEKGNYPEYRTKEQMLNDYLSQ